MRVVVGGTFANMHRGHMALLEKAFEIGDYVFIGLTTDGFAATLKPYRGTPGYDERREALEVFVKRFGKKFDISPIDDKFGPSLKGDFDAIVVSEETLQTALEINGIRKRNGLKALDIVRVDYVLADDSEPISTSRIDSGEIDREGRLIKKK